MRGCYLGFPQVFIRPIPSVKLRVFFAKKDKNPENSPLPSPSAPNLLQNLFQANIKNYPA